MSKPGVSKLFEPGATSWVQSPEGQPVCYSLSEITNFLSDILLSMMLIYVNTLILLMAS